MAALPHVVVKGFAPDDPVVGESYSTWRNLLFSKRSLSAAEIATSLGHRKIWRTVLEQGSNSALVLEDDFQFEDIGRAMRVIATASKLMDQWDIVKLFDFKPRAPSAGFSVDGFDFAIHERPSSGLVGYLISRDGCRKMLAQDCIFIPVDEEVRLWFRQGLRVCSVVPSVVSDISDNLGGSLLEDSRLSIKSRRNALRSIWGNLLTLNAQVRSRAHLRRVLSRL